MANEIREGLISKVKSIRNWRNYPDIDPLSAEDDVDDIMSFLRSKGNYLNGDAVIPARGKFPEIHCPSGMVGHLVFIPEEK